MLTTQTGVIALLPRRPATLRTGRFSPRLRKSLLHPRAALIGRRPQCIVALDGRDVLRGFADLAFTLFGLRHPQLIFDTGFPHQIADKAPPLARFDHVKRGFAPFNALLLASMSAVQCLVLEAVSLGRIEGRVAPQMANHGPEPRHALKKREKLAGDDVELPAVLGLLRRVKRHALACVRNGHLLAPLIDDPPAPRRLFGGKVGCGLRAALPSFLT